MHVIFLSEGDTFNNVIEFFFPINLRELFETLHSLFLNKMFFTGVLLNKYCWEVYRGGVFCCF